VFRVEGAIKEEFVANAVWVEMQCCHLYIVCQATRAKNATSSY
jgi:hypothetical protein